MNTPEQAHKIDPRLMSVHYGGAPLLLTELVRGMRVHRTERLITSIGKIAETLIDTSEPVTFSGRRTVTEIQKTTINNSWNIVGTQQVRAGRIIQHFNYDFGMTNVHEPEAHFVMT